MRLHELTERIEARILTRSAGAEAEVRRAYAGDRMSDLLNKASGETLVVSHLSSSHLLRVAKLMDAPAVCLLDGKTPAQALVAEADRQGTVIMVSPHNMEKTCG